MADTQDGASWTGKEWRRAAQVLVLSVVLTAASIGSYFGLLQYSGNFHVVEKGRFYRSGQLDKTEFGRVIKKYKIKSVLNLRGGSSNRPWYYDELAISAALGVVHYDYGISARRIVTPQQIAAILEIVRRAPKPILVHCEGGADRTGLVAALYRAKVLGASVSEAYKELSLVYGHFPHFTGTEAMDESFWAYLKGS
jgi:protein tyrosine/serine phosphatase